MGSEGLDRMVGVVGVTSRSFVTQVLRLYAERTPFVILKSAAVASALPGPPIGRIIHPERDAGWLAFSPQGFDRDDAPAQVTLTSGTEGAPKPIVLSHRALDDVVTRLIDAMSLDGDLREYVGVPASYSFGLGRFRACAAVGGRAFVPASGFNPVEIAAMLRAGEINAVSAVPTLWRMLLAHPDLFKGAAGALRWIEIGSQHMSASEKRALRSLFPNARIVQHYGLTEASRSTFLNVSEASDDALASVGAPTGDVEVRIDPAGLIQIKGPHLATGVLTASGLVPIADADGWLTTRDEGRLVAGHLQYLGRSDDVINCGGVKIVPDAIEAHLLARLGIQGGVSVGRFRHPLRGDGVVVVVEPVAGARVEAVRAETELALAASGVRAGDALVVKAVDAIPRTPTGKVQRRLLADLAPANVPAPVTDLPAETPGDNRDDLTPAQRDLEDRLARVWRQVLKADDVSRTTNFYDSGGDSLTAIGMMLALEKHGVGRAVATRIFDGETIEQIVRTERPAPAEHAARARLTERVTGDAINVVRGVLVLCLIAIHFLPGVWERLPVDAERVARALHPFYRFGTPGFALVFGLGVGFFYFHQMSRGGRVWVRLRLSAAIVLAGMLLLALFRLGVFTLVLPETPRPVFSALFYSVLTYYFLAVVSIPLWFRLVHREGAGVLRALVASGVCFTAYLVLDEVIGQRPLAFGPAELVRLMLEANYNYFRMTAIVMIGVAVGLHYRTQTHAPTASRLYLTVGALLTLASVLIPYDMGRIEQWRTMQGAELFSVVGYAGVVIGMLGLVTAVRPRVGRAGPAGVAMRVLAACGILSLPAYVFHGLVVPAKDILAATTGLSEAAALACSLTAFFVLSALAVRKVYRLYG